MLCNIVVFYTPAAPLCSADPDIESRTILFITKTKAVVVSYMHFATDRSWSCRVYYHSYLKAWKRNSFPLGPPIISHKKT